MYSHQSHKSFAFSSVQLESNPFLGVSTSSEGGGDSSRDERRARLGDFRRRLEAMADGGAEFHVELDDPAGNSYLQVRTFCVDIASIDSNYVWLGTWVKRLLFLGGGMGGQGGGG